jgi:exosortase
MSATAAVKDRATSSPVSGRIPVISWCALAVITLLLYWPTIRGLLGDWWNDPNYSHGPLIPLVIAYFVYRQWGELRREPLAPRMGIGLSVVVASQLMFLAGYLGAEFFLQRSSIVVLAAGLVLYVAGAHHLRRLLLPLLLFALSIPLPTLLLNFITMPLQLLASAGAELILRSCGLAVYRAGNILRLQTQTLNVSEACSGIRSLTSLVTLAVILILRSRGFSRPKAMPCCISVSGTGPKARIRRRREVELLFKTHTHHTTCIRFSKLRRPINTGISVRESKTIACGSPGWQCVCFADDFNIGGPIAVVRNAQCQRSGYCAAIV